LIAIHPEKNETENIEITLFITKSVATVFINRDQTHPTSYSSRTNSEKQEIENIRLVKDN
jgi:hypothetical protein